MPYKIFFDLEKRALESESRIQDLEKMVSYLFDKLNIGTETKDYVEYLKTVN